MLLLRGLDERQRDKTLIKGEMADISKGTHVLSKGQRGSTDGRIVRGNESPKLVKSVSEGDRDSERGDSNTSRGREGKERRLT